ncbi:hypothetical protein Tco_0725674 [Tanacetum coccineum]|uniref:Uncharacterized protein n=1 Tax=Tanacetum coccineum TaxID=301880 RepID=A0ABQ4YDJ8_9ASTR
MSDKSSPLKCSIIGINVWVKLSKEENVFTPATDSCTSNLTPINCMEKVLYRRLLKRLDGEIPRNRIMTLRRDLFGVANFPRWVKAKVVSSEVEGEKWRRLLLHQMCVAIDVATDGRE